MSTFICGPPISFVLKTETNKCLKQIFRTFPDDEALTFWTATEATTPGTLFNGSLETAQAFFVICKLLTVLARIFAIFWSDFNYGMTIAMKTSILWKEKYLSMYVLFLPLIPLGTDKSRYRCFFRRPSWCSVEINLIL